jgi:polyhydroxybutyrate depolymerase
VDAVNTVSTVKRLLLLLGVVFLGSCSLEGITADVDAASWRAGTLAHNVSVNGATRTYSVRVPPKRRTTAGVPTTWPLVIVLHGSSGNGHSVELQSAMNALADSALFLVAYPDASDGGFGLYPSDWNAGNCCGGAYRNNVDDLAFLTAVISAMSAHVPVDPKRIYVAGFSAGGRMAYHAGCQLSGTFASIAVVSGSLVDQACAPNNPMPMIAFHGTDDPEVSYDEPAPTPPTAVPAAAAPMPPSARFWVGRYRCTSGTPSLISTHTTRIRFTACATGTDIDFYKIQGGTHGWPGGPDAPGNLPPMNEIRASFLIWQFFARHTHK